MSEIHILSYGFQMFTSDVHENQTLKTSFSDRSSFGTSGFGTCTVNGKLTWLAQICDHDEHQTIGSLDRLASHNFRKRNSTFHSENTFRQCCVIRAITK